MFLWLGKFMLSFDKYLSTWGMNGFRANLHRFLSHTFLIGESCQVGVSFRHKTPIPNLCETQPDGTGWEKCVHERTDCAGVRWGVDVSARACGCTAVPKKNGRGRL